MGNKAHAIRCKAYYDKLLPFSTDGRVVVLFHERPDERGESEPRLWLTKIGPRLIAVDDMGGEYAHEADSSFLAGTRPWESLDAMPVVDLIAKWKLYRRQ